jgi:hypothetical protein
MSGGEFGCTLWKLNVADGHDIGGHQGPPSPSRDSLLQPLVALPKPKGRIRRYGFNTF